MLCKYRLRNLIFAAWKLFHWSILTSYLGREIIPEIECEKWILTRSKPRQIQFYLSLWRSCSDINKGFSKIIIAFNILTPNVFSRPLSFLEWSHCQLHVPQAKPALNILEQTFGNFFKANFPELKGFLTELA